MNISQKMMQLGQKRSCIREIFEYSKKRKAEVGAEKVFDFSIGNPSVPAPKELTIAMERLLKERDPVELHGYTSAQGDPWVRQRIAEDLNRRYGADADPNLIYMTCGAAASLTISLHAIMEPEDEVIAFAPFFPEYRVFAEKAGAKFRVISGKEPDFQPDLAALEQVINKKTKAIIINSPNNPSGAIISPKNLAALGALLKKKSEEQGSPIYLISDEPYRELNWTDEKVPYIGNFYDNTLVCYSFSKAVSLPGERIGYILVSPKAQEAEALYTAVCGAGRALGFVCAPSLLQYAVGECVDAVSDFSVYRKNRALLLRELSRIGYEVIPPDGAFYLFMKAPEPDANAFCERAKGHELLLVPGDDFGCSGYVRIAYCVSTEQILNSIPAFEQLYKEYKD